MSIFMRVLLGNKGNMQIKKYGYSVLALALSLSIGWWLFNGSNSASDAENMNSIYGEWVAVSAMCNGDLPSNIKGLDIKPGYLLREGNKVSYERIELDTISAVSDSCDIGPMLYHAAFEIKPLGEKFKLGTVGRHPAIKSEADGVVYFKMSVDFKREYDFFQNN